MTIYLFLGFLFLVTRFSELPYQTSFAQKPDLVPGRMLQTVVAAGQGKGRC